MLIINDFFVRYKEAISNQMELIAKNNDGKIISATRFMGQKEMQEDDLKDNIYVYSPIKYIFEAIKGVLEANRKEKVHIFEEEPSIWKRILLNKSQNPLYISMYRRPDKKYARHLKKYKTLKKVFVELNYHKELLINNGISESKIEVTPTPAKIPRKKSDKKYNPDNINILFASWNNKEGDAIRERGLEYLLKILQINPNTTLTIPLRDNDTEAFEKMAEEMGVRDRVRLLEIHNDTNILIQLFDNADFVSFVPQKRIVKDVPNSLIDGLIRGKPVIISDVIDFSREVKANNIGIVVEKGAEPIKLNVSEAEYTALSQRAYQYSAIHSQQNYLEVIEKSYNNGRKSNFYEQIKAEQTEKCDKTRQKERCVNENCNCEHMGDIR